jgi:hypothetical protein
MKHKNKKMYGGILQDPNDPRNNFFNFLKNSNVTLLSNSSSYGIIFKVDINNTEYSSPYSMFRAKNFGGRVKTLVLKICPLTNEYKKNRDFFLINGKEKKTTTVDDFLREYYAQIFIALDTCKYLETICPFPVYVDFFKKTSKRDDIYDDIPTIPDTNINDEEGSPTDYMFDDKECLDIFKTKFENVEEHDDDSDLDDDDVVIDTESDSDHFGGGKKNVIEQLINYLNDKYDYLGVIAMEIADGYSTLKTFIDNPINYRKYQNFARYEIISMALEQRILHGDFHNENILINPNYEGYFNRRTGKAMLIDFGIINYLSDQDHDLLKNLISQNKYIEVINKIYQLSIVQPLWDYKGYAWFKNVTQEDINEIILLIQQRQESKQQLEDFSREIRISEPATKYPLIPLKLQLYQKYLPKMSYGLFFTGGATLKGGYDAKFFEPTGDQSVITLMEDVFKTISFGMNSFSNISKKIDNIKKQSKTIAPKSINVPKMVNTEMNGNNGITVGVGGKIKINTRKRKYKKNTHKRKYKNKKYTSKLKYK